ncbi:MULTISPECIES: LPXTG cell wall anchor domain-containing protein [Staphylococcus]|nr:MULTISPECIES: LPXTG cell wall anchor domain-containing protein [Staphylococcus]KXA44343.1 LPXTG-motif protein cell wall anchor domain protein [Staphylococcus simulans]OFN21100.1 hypothetical protein HMPREF2603_00045 [Staphylococcus sp. HMSC055C03]OFU76125.1 hypothetical protein HMPREF3110_11105 [Staphylococcus sp. HMSC10C03]OFV07091.1 hypothetical protein HMPREF3124_03690 [Staphylococcus sp. HMSC12H08]OHR56518.1 hypothetical protein HMPREF2798_01715 [Staphylococcus sp. HMSC070A03]
MEYAYADNEAYEPTTDEVTKEHGTPTTEEDVTGAVTIPDYPSDKGTITKSPKNTNGNSVPTKKELPETGQQTDQGNATLFGSLFAVLGTLLLFGRRKKIMTINI